MTTASAIIISLRAQSEKDRQEAERLQECAHRLGNQLKEKLDDTEKIMNFGRSMYREEMKENAAWNHAAKELRDKHCDAEASAYQKQKTIDVYRKPK